MLPLTKIVHSDSLDNGPYSILILLKALFFFSSFTRCRSLRHLGRPFNRTFSDQSVLNCFFFSSFTRCRSLRHLERPFNRNFSDHDFAANCLLPDISLACDKQQQRKWKQKAEDPGLILFVSIYLLLFMCLLRFDLFFVVWFQCQLKTQR